MNDQVRRFGRPITGTYRTEAELAPPGYERFMATGDHLIAITLVCTSCGAVIAANYSDTHRDVCPGRLR